MQPLGIKVRSNTKCRRFEVWIWKENQWLTRFHFVFFLPTFSFFFSRLFLFFFILLFLSLLFIFYSLRLSTRISELQFTLLLLLRVKQLLFFFILPITLALCPDSLFKRSFGNFTTLHLWVIETSIWFHIHFNPFLLFCLFISFSFAFTWPSCSLLVKVKVTTVKWTGQLQ